MGVDEREWVQWVLVSSGVFFVILNAVKNLSVRVGGRAIADCRAIPEILRFTQDDIKSIVIARNCITGP